VRRALEKEAPGASHPVLAPQGAESAARPYPLGASACAPAEANEVAPALAPRPAPSPATAFVPVPMLHFRSAYIVTQDEQGLLIVDQHALHERIMFEELRGRILGEGKPLESQRFLLPKVIPASAARQEALEELRPLLERIGVEAEPFGPKEVAIHAFPSLLVVRGVPAGEFLEELLDRAADGHLRPSSPTATEAALHEVLDMMACKAAVKAGNHLSHEELSDLLRRREDIERSGSCPHGRPTVLRLTVRDLEKQFGRS
jgi:DNA mismatch repair protein MutL